MERLARATATELAVVFDGAPDPQLTVNAELSSMTVYFPYPGSSADDRIAEIVREREDRRNLVIVTSDRGLAERLRPLGVAIIRSGEFRRILEDFTK
jgi:rRNA-processing protein FCF1